MTENNGVAIRVSFDTYQKLDKLRLKKREKNLSKTGRVGDADFDGIINDLLHKNSTKVGE
jgi:hypothetical protein